VNGCKRTTSSFTCLALLLQKWRKALASCAGLAVSSGQNAWTTGWTVYSMFMQTVSCRWTRKPRVWPVTYLTRPLHEVAILALPM
jgi:hypothetical protein